MTVSIPVPRLLEFPRQLARLALASLLVVLPWIIDVNLFAVATDEGRHLKVVWTVGLALCLLGLRALFTASRPALSLFTLGFYAFLLAHLFQLFFGASGFTSFHREVFSHYAAAILVAPLLYHLLRDYDDLAFLRFVVVLGVLLPTLYGLWQELLLIFPAPTLAWWRDPMGWEPNQLLKSRIVSTFGNPNYFGSFTAAALLFLLPMAFKRRQSSLRLGALVALYLAMFLCIYTTKSRGAVLALLVGGFGMLWFGVFLLHRRPHRWMVRAGLVLAMLVVLGGFVYKGYRATGEESLVDRIGEGLQGRSPSINNRMVLWQAALAMWSTRPLLGTGLEQFSIDFMPTLERMVADPDHKSYRVIVANMESIYATNAHNEYVQMLAELGLLGAGIFLFFNVALLWGLVRILRGQARRRQRRAEPTYYALGTIGAILAVLADACASFPLRLPVNAYYYYVFCGAALALIRQHGADLRVPLPRLPQPAWRAAVAAALLLAGATTFWSWGLEYPARHYFHQAKKAVNDVVAGMVERERDARRYLDRTLHFSPEHGEAHFLLARILGATTDVREAQRELERARRTWGNPGIYVQSGHIYFINNDLFRAREQWQRLADLHPKMERIHYMIGLTYYRAGDMERAQQALENEIKYHSEREHAKEAYFYLGEIARRRADWSGAEYHYRKTLAKSKHHFYAHLRLAELYSDPIDNPKKMLDHIQEARRIVDLSQDPALRQEFNRVNLEITERIRTRLPAHLLR